MTGGRLRLLFLVLAFGYAFLYLPILSVIVYSFNESRLVTVWGGLSLRWWRAALANDALLDAAWLSLRIAFVSACAATILGTIAGFALARRARFSGRTLFASLVAAPLVMPEVVMGIAMLLLFVGLERFTGWPERGFLTIVLAHVTFSLAFVAVIVQSRLRDFDRSLEEAAMDLGARPLGVFFAITLPLIMPAVLAGWLLAFTLSIDDLILTQFVAGPASETLPMLIYSSIRLGVNPQVNVLATVLVLLVVAVAGTAALLLRRNTAPSQAHAAQR